MMMINYTNNLEIIFSLLVLSDGKIYSWGVGEQGQLGRKVVSRHVVEASLTPRPINFRPYRMSAKFINAYAGNV